MAEPRDEEPATPHDLPQESISNPSRESDAAGWYRMAGMGFEFVAAILLFGGIGWFLDRQFGTAPWLLIVGFGLGFASGLWIMYKAARKAFK